MAASIAAKAQRRAERFTAAIRDALADGNGNAALTEAVIRLRAEAAKVRRQRPGDAALIDAELAGSIAAIAFQLHAHKPARPPGCPRMPGPDQMLAAFAASYAQAAGEGDGHE